jgi:predicted dehydrogenase
MDQNRRRFLQATTALAAAAPHSAMGANDRVTVGIIGTGTRGAAMGMAAFRYPNADVVASCDVDTTRREAFAKGIGPNCRTYGDYRRVLERKDIDAVLVATPDHWHSPILVQALDAGKHVYVEKPLSNTVEGAVKMLAAVEKYPSRSVQVGTMQRSCAHFQEAVKLIQSGGIGPVTQVIVDHPAGGMAARNPDDSPQPIPEGFDWDMWQGPAPKRPYNALRARNWRSWYAYGGGTMTDWIIHHVDIVHMALDPDGAKPPLYVSAAANYSFLDKPNLDFVPNTWSSTVQFGHFMMTILSCTPPPHQHLIQGPSFFGSKGQLLVNRAGYVVVPLPEYQPYMTTLGGRNKIGVPVPPPVVRTPPPGAAEAGGFAGMGGRGQQGPPIEAKELLLENFSRLERDYSDAHVANWLDCARSGRKPIAYLPVVFNGHLACLMSAQSMRERRALVWDPASRTARLA